MFRRSVLDDVGMFRPDWGSEGDFEWGMRASLAHSTVHIPEALATWRVYQGQATASVALRSAARHERLCDMAKAAVQTARKRRPALYRRVRLRRLLFPYRRLQVEFGVWERSGKLRKLGYLARMIGASPHAVLDFVLSLLLKRGSVGDSFDFVRRELARLGLDKHLEPIATDARQ